MSSNDDLEQVHSLRTTKGDVEKHLCKLLNWFEQEYGVVVEEVIIERKNWNPRSAIKKVRIGARV